MNLINHFLIVLFIVGISGFSIGQELESQAIDNTPKPSSWREKAAETITPTDLAKHLNILASDDMEGRETGTPGNDKAASYIADQFARMGLKTIDEDGDYMQPIEMVSKRWSKMEFYVGEKKFRHLWDYFATHDNNSSTGEFTADEIVFAGYGIQNEEIDHYRDLDVHGKIVMIYGGEPQDENGISLLTGSLEKSEWTTDIKKKLQVARDLGAKMVIIIADRFKEQISKNRMGLIGPRVELMTPGERAGLEENDGFNHIVVNTEMAKEIIGKKINKVQKRRGQLSEGKAKKGFVIKTNISGRFDRIVEVRLTQNVMALLPGKDPSKSKDHIFVTAHYDHLGKIGEDIFNGADDNASGTSTVIELAEAFVNAEASKQGPDRPVVFMLVSGEEKGLLGSQFYTEHPLIPLEHTMVNVNIDMVGRIDQDHEDGNYIYVIGSDRLSTALHQVNEAVNQQFYNLELDYKYNAKDDPNRFYYRSDHYNFAKNGIPAVFFFSGVHKDYHRPSDTAEKIDFNKMTKVSRHIFQLIWELGNQAERIKVDVQ